MSATPREQRDPLASSSEVELGTVNPPVAGSSPASPAIRGANHLVTICTADEPWLTIHLPRWVRYARKNAPGWTLHVLYAGDKMHSVLGRVDCVWRFPTKEARREWFNEVRMSATSILGVERVVYCDCDADVLSGWGTGPALGASTLGCVASWAEHDSWWDVRWALELGEAREMNNGFLVLARDWGREYAAAWAELAKIKDLPDRIKGTLAFNTMLCRAGTDRWVELEPEWSVVWSDVKRLGKARVVQYCNDNGQRKRVELEFAALAAGVLK